MKKTKEVGMDVLAEAVRYMKFHMYIRQCLMQVQNSGLITRQIKQIMGRGKREEMVALALFLNGWYGTSPKRHKLFKYFMEKEKGGMKTYTKLIENGLNKPFIEYQKPPLDFITRTSLVSIKRAVDEIARAYPEILN